MFQYIYFKIDKFGWLELEIISSDACTQFTSTNFKDEFQTRGVSLMLETPEHQEMNRQVKVTQRMFRTISHSLMVHAQVLESYINFALMHTADHILPVIPIKDLINKDGQPNTPFKIATGMKPSILHLRVLFCPCVVRKNTAYVETKDLIMRHQTQKGICGIFVGISKQQKGYLFNVPHKHKIVSSYDFFK